MQCKLQFIWGMNKFLPYSPFISEYGEIQCKEMPHDAQHVILRKSMQEISYFCMCANKITFMHVQYFLHFGSNNAFV